MKRCGDDGERGSVSLFVVVLVFGLLLMIGLVVDGGGKIRATQRADQIAREAARQAGQVLTSDAVRGNSATVDVAQGRAAANTYLTAAGASGGEVTITGSAVHVTAQVTWTPVFLQVIGVNSMSVTGEGTAQVVRVQQGVAR